MCGCLIWGLLIGIRNSNSEIVEGRTVKNLDHSDWTIYLTSIRKAMTEVVTVDPVQRQRNSRMPQGGILECRAGGW